MVRHFRCIPHCSEEYTVRLAKPLHAVRSHHASVLQVVVTAIIEMLIFKLQTTVYISDRIQHFQGGGHHFLSDSIPGYYGKFYVFHMHPPKFSYFYGRKPVHPNKYTPPVSRLRHLQALPTCPATGNPSAIPVRCCGRRRSALSPQQAGIQEAKKPAKRLT